MGVLAGEGDGAARAKSSAADGPHHGRTGRRRRGPGRAACSRPGPSPRRGGRRRLRGPRPRRVGRKGRPSLWTGGRRRTQAGRRGWSTPPWRRRSGATRRSHRPPAERDAAGRGRGRTREASQVGGRLPGVLAAEAPDGAVARRQTGLHGGGGGSGAGGTAGERAEERRRCALGERLSGGGGSGGVAWPWSWPALRAQKLGS